MTEVTELVDHSGLGRLGPVDIQGRAQPEPCELVDGGPSSSETSCERHTLVWTKKGPSILTVYA